MLPRPAAAQWVTEICAASGIKKSELKPLRDFSHCVDARYQQVGPEKFELYARNNCGSSARISFHSRDGGGTVWILPPRQSKREVQDRKTIDSLVGLSEIKIIASNVFARSIHGRCSYSYSAGTAKCSVVIKTGCNSAYRKKLGSISSRTIQLNTDGRHALDCVSINAKNGWTEIKNSCDHSVEYSTCFDPLHQSVKGSGNRYGRRGICGENWFTRSYETLKAGASRNVFINHYDLAVAACDGPMATRVFGDWFNEARTESLNSKQFRCGYMTDRDRGSKWFFPKKFTGRVLKLRRGDAKGCLRYDDKSQTVTNTCSTDIKLFYCRDVPFKEDCRSGPNTAFVDAGSTHSVKHWQTGLPPFQVKLGACYAAPGVRAKSINSYSCGDGARHSPKLHTPVYECKETWQAMCDLMKSKSLTYGQIGVRSKAAKTDIKDRTYRQTGSFNSEVAYVRYSRWAQCHQKLDPSKICSWGAKHTGSDEWKDFDKAAKTEESNYGAAWDDFDKGMDEHEEELKEAKEFFIVGAGVDYVNCGWANRQKAYECAWNEMIRESAVPACKAQGGKLGDSSVKSKYAKDPECYEMCKEVYHFMGSQENEKGRFDWECTFKPCIVHCYRDILNETGEDDYIGSTPSTATPAK